MTDSLTALKEALKHSTYTNMMGAVPTLCEDGKSELELVVTDDMKQHMSIIHGAVLGFVADSACCWASIPQLGNVVTAEYKINFIKPAVGEKIIGKGFLIGATARNAVTRADVYVEKDGKQKLVATAMATIAAV